MDQTSDIVFISAVRDYSAYNRYVRQNGRFDHYSFAPLDNSTRNLPVPVLYNRFLDSYDYLNEAWFIFCHEDLEFIEDPGLTVKGLATSALYGPIGSARIGIMGFGMQVLRGCIKWSKKGEACDGSRSIGRYLTRPARVDTFDCCCLIVHSSLVNKFKLRFDEELKFDLYVEDFCASAKEQHNILSYAVQMDVCHHSDSPATERLWRHLPYLAEKYKTSYFTGTLTYFGTPSWQKRLQDWVLRR